MGKGKGLYEINPTLPTTTTTTTKGEEVFGGV